MLLTLKIHYIYLTLDWSEQRRQVGPEEQKIEYEGINGDDKERELGRMGHLAFIDESTGHLVIFGGQRKGD